MIRKLLLLLFALLPLVASAYDVESNGVYYDISEDGATVTYRDGNYNSYSGRVYIASSIDYGGKTYPVTSIGDYAFYECEELTYVYIPTSVKSIGDWTFYYCI
ncbi:MAG: leucine-rich repeat protein [Prevotella sp.]|nr:leucine-rich repeat protein [Prevotella sp.]MBQ9293923.1 leucine-rich repeat protein [Bacteroidaceae bacterium]